MGVQASSKYMSHFEVVEVNVWEATHSKIKVVRGQDIEELKRNDGGKATPHAGHAVVT